MGLTRNFHGKKRGPEIFWGSKKNFQGPKIGALKNFHDKYFLHQAPLQVFVNGPLRGNLKFRPIQQAKFTPPTGISKCKLYFILLEQLKKNEKFVLNFLKEALRCIVTFNFSQIVPNMRIMMMQSGDAVPGKLEYPAKSLQPWKSYRKTVIQIRNNPVWTMLHMCWILQSRWQTLNQWSCSIS